MSEQNNDLTPSSGSEDIGKEELFELLNVDDKEDKETLDLTPKKEEKEDEEVEELDENGEPRKKEEVDELEELENELKPPTEEQLELITPVRRKEILAKYPTLFKDFPYLEKAYYRDQQFTEVFPTLDDARDARDKAAVMDGFERHVGQNGNISIVLQAIKEDNADNGEVFKQVVDSLLPALHHVDEGAYWHVLGNILRETIKTAVERGKELGEEGEPLINAASVLHQFIFNTNRWTPPRPLSSRKPEDRAKEQENQSKEQQALQTQITTTTQELQTKVDNIITATIDQHIDPKQSMTKFVKTHATKEAFEEVNRLINSDTRFRALLDKLWERAIQDNFNQESVGRIRSAWLSKAKTLLPTVIKKARNNALAGLGRRVESDNSDRRGPITPGRSTSPNRSRSNSKEVPKGMSTLDFLSSD